MHSDLNSFYASVECLHRPEIRFQPVAVGGDAEQRHGIILAKNDFAKPYQIDLFNDQTRRDELETLESAVDGLRQRFGNFCVRRAALLKDEALTGFNPKQDNTIHSVDIFKEEVPPE